MTLWRSRLVVTLLGGGLIVLAAAFPATAAPVTFPLASHPTGWGQVICDEDDALSFASGVMRSSAVGGCAYERLDWPNGEWHATVDSSRGWAIQTRLRVDAGPTSCNTNNIWASANDNLLMFGFGRGAVCLVYPNVVTVPFNTTSGFHVYRFHFKQNVLTISIDGVQRASTTVAPGGGGTQMLAFGTVENATSIRQTIRWDSFTYDVAIGLAACTRVGTALSDVLYGTSGADNVCGGYGNDVIYSLGGNDQLSGGYGNDRLYGAFGNDRLHGEAGNDSLFGGAGADIHNGASGFDSCDGGVDTAIDTANGCETRLRIP